MMDELDTLKAALRASPAPDPQAKDAAILLAMNNFDRLQGSADPARSNQDRPVKAGVLQGMMSMLNALKTKQFLAVTTSVAALCIGLVVVLPLSGQGPLTAPPPVSPVPVSPVLSKPKVAPEPAAPESTAPEAETDAVSDAQANEALKLDMASPEPQSPAPIVGAVPNPTMGKAAPNPAPRARKCLNDCAAGEAHMESAAAAAALATAPETIADQPVMDGTLALSDDELSLALPQESRETFANAAANPVYVTAENPVSTFSIDVDTASYATIRSSLNAGFLPDPASVRIEEMINYFPYAYAAPKGDQPFQPTITVMPTPWNPDTRLVHVAIQGAMPAAQNRPPLNLVFLIDTSGSMDEPNKLPLLVQSLSMLQGQLHEGDQVAIVAYAGSAGQVLAPTQATDQAAIRGALNQLAAGGSTAGGQGLELAYQTAETMAAPGEVTRVLLATDGDFNVGIDDPEALKTYIATKRETGVYLSVLGFGRGNLDDATMQALAQNGNGTASYIDTLAEARKVLVDQLAGAMYPIADNVKIQIEWNPAQVAEYRLIGYETRALRREDFNNDAVDAGDIGAGTAVTAIYEVTAPDSPALLHDPLRYGAADPIPDTPELGFLRLRSVAPGAATSTLLETPIVAGTAANDDARFAAAIAGFGQLLTGATYLGDWGWDQAIELALGARGADEFGYRAEAVNLMRTAKTLAR